MAPQIDLTKLRSELDYNPTTGVFTWQTARQGQPSQGSEAGSIDKSTGFRKIGWAGKIWMAHRLAWMYEHGPIEQSTVIKQHNEDRADCRISNLYAITAGENRRALRLTPHSAKIANRREA